MVTVGHWVTSPYCFCRGAAWNAVQAVRIMPPVGGGFALVPIAGLSREETAILAAFLIALAFFLFFLFCILCCLCPWLGWWGGFFGGGAAAGAGGKHKHEHLNAVTGAASAASAAGAAGAAGAAAAAGRKNEGGHLNEVYKLPRAWVDTFRGIPEDQLDAKIRELESSGWAGLRHNSGSGYGGGGYTASSGYSTGNRAMMRGAGGPIGVSGTGDVINRNMSTFSSHHGALTSGRDAMMACGYGDDLASGYSRSGLSASSNNNMLSARGGPIVQGHHTTDVINYTRTNEFSSSRDATNNERRGYANDFSSSSSSRDVTDSGGRGVGNMAVSTLRDVGEAAGCVEGLKTVQLVKETSQRTTTTFDGDGGKETKRTTTTKYSTGGVAEKLAEIKQMFFGGPKEVVGGSRVTSTTMTSNSGGREIAKVTSTGYPAVMTSGTGGMEMVSMSNRGAQGQGAIILQGLNSDDYLYEREIQREIKFSNKENFTKLYNAYRRYLTDTDKNTQL
ncbi:uncharacterized protein LOC121373272 [Gigantopelta aegis]|uniref:uncharacterized protein LOC121373272 n=1 Tax=Gigantopelta aegis TaxID=1735272 RepID=UPI001B8878A9|nr:uncharacterized protein LOC121373272 [Gigantopelta aegis]